MRYSTTTLLAALAGTVSSQAADWQQCGGTNWSGATTCGANAGCVKLNDYYSQCQPGAAAPAPAPTTLQTSALPATTASEPQQTDTPSTGGTSPSATGPGKTLQSGYYWIRAVSAPNYHKYMQTSPLYSVGTALLGDYTTAGQFQVVDGQLVQLVSAPGEAVKLLYAAVNETKVVNGNSLGVSFSETKNTYGKFAFQGDGLTWTVSGITRPNAAAWYVCAGQKMYINLGNYMYQTPSGCADQTIHYYNDKTANN